MEIEFENKTSVCYREFFCTSKRIQESMESVVPDTNEDIGKIASVQTTVLLKGKEANGHTLRISGEVQAVLLYITEDEQAVSFLRLTKPFTMDYDVAEEVREELCQVNLNVTNSEARMLNPRKVSLTVEITGELCCYRQDTACIGMELPTELPGHIHTLTDKQAVVLNSIVTEKTFAFNEQFPFPAGKPVPSQLLAQNACFRILEAQQVGSRVIVKGNLALSVSYLSDEVDYPVQVEISSPFSQIAEIGDEESSHCVVSILPTSSYYELIDTISGEKALDTELHAVMQIVSRSRKELVYVTDAYSNRQEIVCRRESLSAYTSTGMQAAMLRENEEITIADDCADVLAVFPTLSHVNNSGGNLSAAVLLDVIYRKADGRIGSVRRLMNPELKEYPSGARLVCADLREWNFQPEGSSMQTEICVEAIYQCITGIELQPVVAVDIPENAQWETEAFPAVTLVRQEGESLWALAKTYHSSVEAIQTANEEDTENDVVFLLIPKEI